LDLKLIDQLGGLTTAIGLAKKLAGIPPDEEVGFVVLPRRRSFWEMLFGGSPFGVDIKTPAGLDKALKTVRLMQRTSIWALTPLPAEPR
jgi:protease-4